jgi:lipoate-protein ligase A
LTTWRLLEPETHNAFVNMAVDEAIMTARTENLTPSTLRLYRWRPSAVSIGRFQDMEKEVQLDNCRKHGVDAVRRITGGGAVYHALQDEVTYSVVAKKDDLAAEDITAVYAKIYNGLAEALEILGIHADFNQGNEKTCPNLTIKGRKISGSAQAHRREVVLQHGTLLQRVNLERMFTFLRVPWATSRAQVARVARNKITSIDAELEKSVSIAQVKDALVKGFEKALDVKLVRGQLSARELELSRSLWKKKYCTDEWNVWGESNHQE